MSCFDLSYMKKANDVNHKERAVNECDDWIEEDAINFLFEPIWYALAAPWHQSKGDNRGYEQELKENHES